MHDETDRLTERTVLPRQRMPAHDAIVREVPPSAHWERRRAPQFLAGVLIVLTWLGLAFFTTLAILQRSWEYGAAAVGCLAGMVLVRSLLMTSGHTLVDLQGSRLTVHRGGFVDTVDLGSSYSIVEVTGDPRSRGWRLAVETVDGRVLELGPRDVDAAAVDAAVRYYREVGRGHGPHHDPIRWRG